jgi:predicted amidohydrolase
MNIAVSAYPITFHASFAAWERHLETWVQAAAHQADVLVFPEYGSLELVSLFPEAIRQDLHGQIAALQGLWEHFQQTFARLAATSGCILVAPSFPLKVGNHFVNRAMVFAPGGQTGYQDKWFMTPFERFDWHIDSGEKVLTVFETAKGSFGIQICYDSEFAIGSRLLAAAGADVILVPSCTETLRGATRVHIGSRARAMENQCYTLVSQTIGEAAWSPAVDLNYGYTAAYSTPDMGFPEEGVLQQRAHQEAGWLIQSLDLALLEQVRKYGAVRNFEDHAGLEMRLAGEAIRVEKVVLL